VSQAARFGQAQSVKNGRIDPPSFALLYAIPIDIPIGFIPLWGQSQNERQLVRSMKIQQLVLPLLAVLLLLVGTLPSAADPIQTQSASQGDLEVDVIKAAAKEGILTIQIAYRNPGNSQAPIKYGLGDVYFLDTQDKKKYHVLKDSQGAFLAAPDNGYGEISGTVPASGKIIVWFKFPAPPASTTKINLVVPNVLPFEDLPIAQ
jgi:hypothetical protein